MISLTSPLTRTYPLHCGAARIDCGVRLPLSSARRIQRIQFRSQFGKGRLRALAEQHRRMTLRAERAGGRA